jgi:DNA-binding transcriptional LysR family regulator
MPDARDALTPDNLMLLQRIAEAGSFAAAARLMDMVPSALTYRVRQIEDGLDVLLFDRSARHTRVTEAGAELLREGVRLLSDIDAVAQRVKRVATGWEPFFTIAVDAVLAHDALMDLVDGFLATSPPTRLRLRDEILSGTLGALLGGQADLAIGVSADAALSAGLHFRPLGAINFVFVMAPHHPLAALPEPLAPADVQRHRAVAVADSAAGRGGLTLGLLQGQDVLTVPTLQAKIEAQLRGLGVGSLPCAMAQPYIASGRLIQRRVDQPERTYAMGYAWRSPAHGEPGKALQWWLTQLQSARTREAFIGPAPSRASDKVGNLPQAKSSTQRPNAKLEKPPHRPPSL